MDTTKLGFDIFDIRDFFDKNFVVEYEEVTRNSRNFIKKSIKNCIEGLPYKDGCPSWEPDLIPYMIKLLDEDFSYLLEPTYYHRQTNDTYPQLDHNFTHACFEYFDKNGIDESSTNKDIPGLSTLSNGFYHLCLFKTLDDFKKVSWIPTSEYKLNTPFIKYLLMTDEINIKLIKESEGTDKLPFEYEVGDWMKYEDRVINNQVPTRKKKLNLFLKKSFQPIHQDDTYNEDEIRKDFTIMNYPNVDRKVEDGCLFRYYLDDRKTFYDTLTNYTTVIVMNHRRDNDIVGKLYHAVTKNTGDVRYSIYSNFP